VSVTQTVQHGTSMDGGAQRALPSHSSSARSLLTTATDRRHPAQGQVAGATRSWLRRWMLRWQAAGQRGRSGPRPCIFELYLELQGSCRWSGTRPAWLGRQALAQPQGQGAGRPTFTAPASPPAPNVAYTADTLQDESTLASTHHRGPQLFQRVQALLRRTSGGGTEVRNAFGFVLKDCCAACPASAHEPTHTSRNGTSVTVLRVQQATKHGRKTAVGLRPCAEIENFGSNGSARLGQTGAAAAGVRRAVRQDEARLAELEPKRRRWKRTGPLERPGTDACLTQRRGPDGAAQYLARQSYGARGATGAGQGETARLGDGVRRPGAVGPVWER